jgi:hypothetical protein
MALEKWALPQLSKLLPLDEESLKQIIAYTETLPKAQAAEHLGNLLGDSPSAIEFITTFNSRRQQPAASFASAASHPKEDLSEVPKPKHKKKKAAPFNKLPEPRRPEPFGDTAGAYIKKDEDDYYMSGRPKPRKEPHLANALSLNPNPDALQVPNTKSNNSSATPSRTASPKLPPSAAGRLISDSKPSSRSSSPASKGKTKVTITGGTPMHGQSTALSDLESAIRELEVQTNPSLAPTPEENARRRCKCMAQRHALLDAAPNCTNCGKIICVKEGLGPCTFCNSPLLSAHEVQTMIRILREERGKERQEANNAAHKRAEVAMKPRPFSGSHFPTPGGSAPTSDSESEKLSAAKQHRDRLLAFQAQNAKRTRVHDEAADFETPESGQNMWATPAERALQLKKQQKILREQEWYARPEWEKKRVVASIDLVGGKVVRRMANIERPKTPESEEDVLPEESTKSASRGAFSKNPLLGGLIRPVARVQSSGKGKEKAAESTSWRRVQDDKDDNEHWILDGGLHGGEAENQALGSVESTLG